MKHLEHTLTTYMYNHCNICNIQIKHLQHTSKTHEIYACNIRFQRNIYLLLGRMEARRRETRCRGVARAGCQWAGRCSAHSKWPLRWRRPRRGALGLETKAVTGGCDAHGEAPQRWRR
jgi:hypothetical protein